MRARYGFLVAGGALPAGACVFVAGAFVPVAGAVVVGGAALVGAGESGIAGLAAAGFGAAFAGAVTGAGVWKVWSSTDCGVRLRVEASASKKESPRKRPPHHQLALVRRFPA